MGTGTKRALLAGVAVLAATMWAPYGAQPAGAASRVVEIVAGESEYGNVASQIGGPYVRVYSVDSNPNTDPHTYEATPAVGEKIAAANLLVENGVGYDSFMTKLASASASPTRMVINVQRLRGLSIRTPNPHLWYTPKTMPVTARAIARDLASLDPAHARTFRANENTFVHSLQPWLKSIATFRAEYHGITAATTEPVADYLLQAMGIKNRTPYRFQADIMNGTTPTPQDVALERSFFTTHAVKVFCYNEQVTDALTDSIRQRALQAGIPVVGVYETMPEPGYDYQSWMLAEVAAIKRAVVSHKSTQRL